MLYSPLGRTPGSSISGSHRSKEHIVPIDVHLAELSAHGNNPSAFGKQPTRAMLLVGGAPMPYGLKVGIIVAIVIGFAVGFVGADQRILRAVGFATACEGAGCKGDPVRTLVILGVAVVTVGFLAIRPTLKKLLVTLVVIAMGIGFFAYTKPGTF
jgi:hypothetical protein